VWSGAQPSNRDAPELDWKQPEGSLRAGHALEVLDDCATRVATLQTLAIAGRLNSRALGALVGVEQPLYVP
jgi:hypothetical protein